MAPPLLRLLISLLSIIVLSIIQDAGPRSCRRRFLRLQIYSITLAEAVVQLTVLVEQVQLEGTKGERLEDVEKGVDDLAAIGATQRPDEEAVVVVVLAQNRFARAEVSEPGVERS